MNYNLWYDNGEKAFNKELYHEAKSYFARIISNEDKINDTELIAKTWLRLSVILTIDNDYVLFQSYYNKSLSFRNIIVKNKETLFKITDKMINSSEIKAANITSLFHEIVKLALAQNEFKIAISYLLKLVDLDISKLPINKNEIFKLLGDCHKNLEKYDDAINFYKKAATLGNVTAHTTLANAYIQGIGTQVNIDLAFEHYLKSDFSLSDNLIKQMGNYFFSRHSNKQDYTNARNCYEKMKSITDFHIFNNLGDIYFLGLGVEQDYDKALSWYKKINEQNYSDIPNSLENIADTYFYKANEKFTYYYKKSLFIYSKCLELYQELHVSSFEHIGYIYSVYEKKKDKSLEFYEKAIEKGSIDALEVIGNIYYEDKDLQDISKAINYYEQLINKSNNYSNYVKILDRIGDYYFFENRDYDKAIKYYEFGSTYNSYEAKLQLGAMYISGVGVKKNTKKGIHYYEEASKLLKTEVCYRLGDIYYEGILVEKNLILARQYYREAYKYKTVNDDTPNPRLCEANDYWEKGKKENKNFFLLARKILEELSEKGYVKAQTSLALFWNQGYGGKNKLYKALECYEKAAAQNNTVAIGKLGDYYFDSKEIPVDWEQAKYFYEQIPERELSKERKINLDKINFSINAKNYNREHIHGVKNSSNKKPLNSEPFWLFLEND